MMAENGEKCRLADRMEFVVDRIRFAVDRRQNVVDRIRFAVDRKRNVIDRHGYARRKSADIRYRQPVHLFLYVAVFYFFQPSGSSPKRSQSSGNISSRSSSSQSNSISDGGSRPSFSISSRSWSWTSSFHSILPLFLKV